MDHWKLCLALSPCPICWNYIPDNGRIGVLPFQTLPAPTLALKALAFHSERNKKLEKHVERFINEFMNEKYMELNDA